MSLRGLRTLAARLAAGALLATPVVVTFADTVGSVGTVTGCSMRVCVTNHKYWKKDSCVAGFRTTLVTILPTVLVYSTQQKLGTLGPNEIFLPHYMCWWV